MDNQKPTTVYTYGERMRLSDAVRGVLPGTVKVDKYGLKVRNHLMKWSVFIDRQAVNQQVKRGTNNQDLFRAVFAVLQNERPDLSRKLFNGKAQKVQAV